MSFIILSYGHSFNITIILLRIAIHSRMIHNQISCLGSCNIQTGIFDQAQGSAGDGGRTGGPGSGAGGGGGGGFIVRVRAAIYYHMGTRMNP
jgi:hypothetical protein